MNGSSLAIWIKSSLLNVATENATGDAAVLASVSAQNNFPIYGCGIVHPV